MSAPAEPQDADKSQPVAEAAPWPQPETRTASSKAPSAALAAAPASKAEPPAVAQAADAPVYTRDQLPDNIRAALPPLTIGGSMYSANPANRSLVVNGGLYREHDQLTADLSLEQIKLKAAIFKFRGYRFEIQF
ncbi:MAG: general secretion pathway protein GspB [Gemmatimonadota bacterium]